MVMWNSAMADHNREHLLERLFAGLCMSSEDFISLLPTQNLKAMWDDKLSLNLNVSPFCPFAYILLI